MKKQVFDFIIILIIGLISIGLNKLGQVEENAKFIFLPILTFYYIGQYSMRKFK
ncbi:MAG: hypothetical protein U9N51_00105 [Bacteroidota bacterium]|nr:hypothetical protein [Bacteroidota bacterium]